ncbi:uncharacterized protein [Misgurnus anguillicaudatus]|uniref:uncharacterized protein isoform X2 n=1 Tax=Misgurnus anguillicaudatus TaxID=75329 RepID=UPI003CCF7D54
MDYGNTCLMALLLRVVISSTDARLQLFEVPQSVESLISILKEKLQLQGHFILQFQDPDFGNALCSLTDISELMQSCIFPEHPCNHTDASLEEQRLLLIDETKKARSNMVVIRENFFPEEKRSGRRSTNSCRRAAEVACTFSPGTGQQWTDLHQSSSKVYRARKTAFGEDMEQLLERLDERMTDILKTDIVNHRRTTALKGLPLFLREDLNKLFKTCKDTEDGAKAVSIGILCVLEDETQGPSPEVVNIAVVLEQVVVLKDLPDISTALTYLFGLLYALNMSYPQAFKYTFDTIQNVFIELGSGCTKRVLSLKNKLL